VHLLESHTKYEVSIISRTGAPYCTVVVVVRCNCIQSFMQPVGCANILCTVIWSLASGQIWFHNGSDKGTESDFEQISEKV
jgi:hypothetical protein